MNENEIHAGLGLLFLDNVGDILAKNLASYCGSFEAVFKTPAAKLEKIPGVGKLIAQSIVAQKDAALKRADKELVFVEKNKIKVISYLHSDYPKKLIHCYDAPFLLFLKGNIDLNCAKIVSIVGTRKASEYGKKMCENLIQALSPYQPIIVSGLAYGIDICAHKAALAHQLPTLAVVGHGLDNLYPEAHQKIAQQMLSSNGGLLSDFPSETPFVPANFPKRNRIVAGIADATIVIETMLKGGSMITAEIANSYNKDVFAIPGNIDKPTSQGCNYLIKTNKAALLDDANELPEILGWHSKPMPKVVQPTLFLDLSENEKNIFSLLEKMESLSIDEIAFQTQLSASETASALLNLEFQGVVQSLPGKIYKAC